MSKSELCPLCDGPNSIRQREPHRDVYHFECEICGRFGMSGFDAMRLRMDLDWKDRRWILTGLTRRASDNGHPLMLNEEVDLEDLVKEAPIPQTPFEAMDRLLLLIFSRVKDLRGQSYFSSAKDYPLLFLKDASYANAVLNDLSQASLVVLPSLGEVVLHKSGWKRVEELRKTGANSNQAFVAMSFHASLHAVRDEALLPALRAVGYESRVLSLHEHNGLIDDLIISEIRRSALLVADFTGQRGGVYLECGFAMGLGIPVVRSCSAAEESLLHFDVNHYNVILWTSIDDLRVRLERRIRATIPGRATLTA